MEKINLYKMEIHEVGKIDNHYILRVPGGWIYADRRGSDAVGTFVPFSKNRRLGVDFLIDRY